MCDKTIIVFIIYNTLHTSDDIIFVWRLFKRGNTQLFYNEQVQAIFIELRSCVIFIWQKECQCLYIQSCLNLQLKKDHNGLLYKINESSKCIFILIENESTYISIINFVYLLEVVQTVIANVAVLETNVRLSNCIEIW